MVGPAIHRERATRATLASKETGDVVISAANRTFIEFRDWLGSSNAQPEIRLSDPNQSTTSGGTRAAEVARRRCPAAPISEPARRTNRKHQMMRLSASRGSNCI
jgi:hypothetical protein